MKKTLAPQQARSRESLARLLNAAAALLQEGGLEGATIPLISKRAGLSPGAVYRRFPDKDALLQTVMITLWQQNEQVLNSLLAGEMATSASLEKALEYLLGLSVKGFRQNSRLLTALVQYYRGHSDIGFKQQIDVIEARSVVQVVAHLMKFRKEIHHPDPGRAIAFAFTLAGHAIREVILMETMTDVYAPFLPGSDESLVEELTMMMLGYLQSTAPTRPRDVRGMRRPLKESPPSGSSKSRKR